MSASLNELIGRDIEALEADITLLCQKVETVSRAHKAGDFSAICHRAAWAEEVARRIRDRLTEVSVQAARSERSAS